MSDPDLNKCVKDNAIAALPNVLKGDSSINLPSLTPFHINEANITVGPSLQLTLRDCDIHGLERAVIEEAK